MKVMPAAVQARGEGGIFGEETVAGMDCVAAGVARGGDDFIDGEIAFAGGRGADGVGFVGEANVERFAIDFAEDGGGAMSVRGRRG